MGETMISDEHDPSGYRPVSGLAVASLAAGALSAVALVNPFFWVVPLVATGLACLGLADVSRAGAEKAGRAAALAGLALAIGFGAQSVSSAVTTRWIATARAREVASLWIKSLRDGRVDDARAMCLVSKLDEIAEQVARCGTSGRTVVSVVGHGEENPETWLVRATIEPCAAGPVDLAIEVIPSLESRQQGPIERWVVVKCEAIRR